MQQNEKLSATLERYQKRLESLKQREREYTDECEVGDFSYETRYKSAIDEVTARIDEITSIIDSIKKEISKLSEALKVKQEEYDKIKSSNDDEPDLYIELREIQSTITALTWVIS